MSSDNRSPVSPSLFDFDQVEPATAIADQAAAIAADRREERRQAKKSQKAQRRAPETVPKARPISRPTRVATPIYLSVRELSTRWGVGVSTIWRWAHQARIPAPVAIGPRATRWEIAAIESYERDRREGAR